MKVTVIMNNEAVFKNKEFKNKDDLFNYLEENYPVVRDSLEECDEEADWTQDNIELFA